MSIQSKPANHDSATVERLLEAAAQQFAQHGYGATRIRDVVDAAGVNLAAVNYHFGGKEGLYRATLEALAGHLQGETPANSLEVRQMSPEDQLRAYLRVMLQRHLASGETVPLSRIIAHELLDPTPAFGQLLESAGGPQWSRLREILSALLGPDASNADLALASLSVVGQWAFFLFGRRMFEHQFPEIARGREAIDQLAEHIASFSIAGVRARRTALEAARQVPVAVALPTRPEKPVKPLVSAVRSRRLPRAMTAKK